MDLIEIATLSQRRRAARAEAEAKALTAEYTTEEVGRAMQGAALDAALDEVSRLKSAVKAGIMTEDEAAPMIRSAINAFRRAKGLDPLP